MPEATVAAALRRHVPAYLKTFGDRVPLGHRKVLSYITRCRTGELGSLLYQCGVCDKQHWLGLSCGNRHCPNCQKQKTSVWLAKQTQKLLPVQHFVVTFTVPKELRALLRANQKAGYGAIFNAGQQTIRALLKNPKHLGSDRVGFFGALHTWGRDIKDFHPHVHFVVPGGGVSADGSRWLQTPAGFLFPAKAAAAFYKQQFVELLRQSGLYDRMPYGVLKKNWVVNIKPVSNGAAVLKYLAPYVYRVAISDNRIESVDDDGVTYRVKPSGKNYYVDRRLSGQQFVGAFAQHILPSNFQKLRYYGFMSPNCRFQLEDVRWLVWQYRDWVYWLGCQPEPPQVQTPTIRCNQCGSDMELRLILGQRGQVLYRAPLTRQRVRPPP